MERLGERDVDWVFGAPLGPSQFYAHLAGGAAALFVTVVADVFERCTRQPHTPTVPTARPSRSAGSLSAPDASALPMAGHRRAGLAIVFLAYPTARSAVDGAGPFDRSPYECGHLRKRSSLAIGLPLGHDDRW